MVSYLWYEVIRVNGSQLLLSKIISWVNEEDVEKIDEMSATNS